MTTFYTPFNIYSEKKKLLFYLQFTHKTSSETITFGPAFNKQFLDEVFRLQEMIERIGRNKYFALENICFAPVTYAGQNATIDQCTVQSIYGYFGNSMEKFNWTESDAEGHVQNYLNILNKCFTYEWISSHVDVVHLIYLFIIISVIRSISTVLHHTVVQLNRASHSVVIQNRNQVRNQTTGYRQESY